MSAERSGGWDGSGAFSSAVTGGLPSAAGRPVDCQGAESPALPVVDESAAPLGTEGHAGVAAGEAGPGPDVPEDGDGEAGADITEQEEVLAPALPINAAPFGASPARLAGRGPRPAKRLVSPQAAAAANRKLTPEQKLLILDTWQRSGLSSHDYSALVGINRITLYQWRKRFEELGPAGLMEQPRRGGGSRAPELTKRTILMLKQAHPEWGCQRISDILFRGPGLPASANTVARILCEAGYVLEESPTAPHPDKVRSFERARPNQLWQTDLFTFILKRQNRRVYLVAFMDDHSRYIVGYGVHASCTAPLVIEAFRAAVAAVGTPEEVLTDNGPQYVTWRGTSQFARELQRRGVKHIVATPRRPQTLGKVERFWGTLWRECLDAAVFLDLADAQKRVGHFIDYYNFQRPHQGIEGLTPADRFFGAAPQMLSTLKARVQAHALELARQGTPKSPFYVTGQVNGKPFSVHAEGERVFMLTEAGERKEIDLCAAGEAALVGQGPAASEPVPDPVCAHGLVSAELQHEAPPAPGASPLDEGLAALQTALGDASPAPEGGDL